MLDKEQSDNDAQDAQQTWSALGVQGIEVSHIESLL
jgi:hypothetical protein